MLKVDIIYGGDIYAPNGASVLMRKIHEASGLFFNAGVEHRLISPSKELAKAENAGTLVHNTSTLKRIVRKITKYSLIISLLRYHRNLIVPANKALDLYEKMPVKGDFVVFHELWTYYAYKRRFKDATAKTIMVIHGDGDLWKGQYIDMPRFKSILMVPYRKRFEKLVLESDRIGFDAEQPRDYFCKTYHYDEKKSFFVYNGIELRQRPQMTVCDKLRLICIATLNDRKNQMGILNAVGMLSKENQQKVEIILVGDGPSRKALEERASHLTSPITFAGTMKEPQYYDLMLKSNCFCLYSKEEGLPIAVIEGMRAGLPILGSKVGGIPEEVVNGKSGFVVDLDDTQLAEKIKWLIMNLDTLPEMGKVSYQLYVDKFTTQAMVNKYVEVYNY
jgi:glycosyltransferase involved in cell wall biosynthesis